MSLADYLAKNYLTADSPKQTEKKSKKRKRKAGTPSESGLIIAEDDITGWEKKSCSVDEDAPTTGIIIRIPFPSLPPHTQLYLFSHTYLHMLSYTLTNN